MTDRIRISLEQVRNDKTIFDLTGNWYEFEDWAANRMATDLVGSVIELAKAWDRSLTSGVLKGNAEKDLTTEEMRILGFRSRGSE